MKFYDGITDFIFVADKPQKADIIFIPGGSYPEAAEYAAQLYHAGYAPLLLPSGKYSVTVGHFVEPQEMETGAGSNCAAGAAGGKAGRPVSETGAGSCAAAAVSENAGEDKCRTECEYLCKILTRCGVPPEAVLREDEATFTWENAIFSRRRLEESGIRVEKALICCQAFHARRCLMYYQEQFPETEFRVCPVVTRGIARDTWYKSRAGIDTVLGEVKRCGVQFGEILAQHAGIS